MIERLGGQRNALQVVGRIWGIVCNGRDDDVVAKVDALVRWMYDFCGRPVLTRKEISYDPEAVVLRHQHARFSMTIQ
jgi:hypothetical protein